MKKSSAFADGVSIGIILLAMGLFPTTPMWWFALGAFIYLRHTTPTKLN